MFTLEKFSIFENKKNKLETDFYDLEKNNFNRHLEKKFQKIAYALTLITALVVGFETKAASMTENQEVKKIEQIKQEKQEQEKVIEKKDFYLFDNHNWALYAWGKDILNGKIPSKNNKIFHIDAHCDMGYDGIPTISKELMDSWQNPLVSSEIKLKLLKQEAQNTRISNFIIKAIALGMSKEIYWVKPRWGEKPSSETVYYKIETEEFGNKVGINLIKIDDPSGVNKDEKIVAVHEINANQIINNVGSGPVIFDLDLDYFSCSEQGAPELVEKELLDKLGIKYNLSDVKNGKIKNPFATVYKASLKEIKKNINEINKIKKILSNSKRPLSKTIAVSPDFLFEDQIINIKNNFFDEK